MTDPTWADADGRTYRFLREASDITEEILSHVASCIDWFPEGEPMPTEEFIDRLCNTYGGAGYGRDGFEIEDYDSPAARKIMREARRMRKERDA